MKRHTRWASIGLLLLLPLFGLGCGTTGPADGPPPVVDNTGPAALRAGTAVAVQIGLTLAKDQAAAQADARIAKQVIETTILPMLQGNLTIEQAQALLANPVPTQKSAIAGTIIAAALPSLIQLVQGWLTPAPGQTQAAGLDPQAKAYMTAFFSGALDGINAYLAGVGMKRLELLR
jgi:hypothetical protein